MGIMSIKKVDRWYNNDINFISVLKSESNSYACFIYFGTLKYIGIIYKNNIGTIYKI